MHQAINQEKNVSFRILKVLHIKLTILDSNSMGTNAILFCITRALMDATNFLYTTKLQHNYFFLPKT